MKDLGELVRAARLSNENGDYKERDRLCDDGLRMMTRLLASGGQFHDTTAAFGTSASVYDRMADLHEIKGEKNMAKVYRRQAAEIMENFTEYMYAVSVSAAVGRKEEAKEKNTRKPFAEMIRRD
jgi:hypothetical protein